MSKRRLPLLVERTLADIYATQLQMVEAFDQKTLNTVGAAITCSEGCSNCCYHPFFISVAEGIVLYRYLAENGLWTPSFQKRVEDTRTRTLGTAWGVWLLSNIPCPLLENDRCVAYEVRPMNCRMTYAISDPEYCHVHKLGEETQQIPRVEPMKAFRVQEAKLLKRHDLKGVLVPLSEAVLAGEAVVNGTTTLERIEEKFLMDFAMVAHGS